MRPYAIPYRCLSITLKNADSKIKSSHCLQLLPNLSSIGTRGRACDAHRPQVLAWVILGIGLLGLDLPSIRLFGGDGWIRTTALFRGQIYSLVQSTTLPRLQNRISYWLPRQPLIEQLLCPSPFIQSLCAVELLPIRACRVMGILPCSPR